MSILPSFRTIEISEQAFTEPGLRFVTVKSAALRRRADVALYAPLSPAVRSLPLVILLHGVYGSHWAWAFKGGAHRLLERLVQSGDVPPMMLAMPSDGLWGDGSGYLPHEEADYESWIVNEAPAVAAQVDSRVTGAPVFISGLSMGGYGALRLGALYGERFAGISAHSSITDYTQMEGFLEEPLSDFRLRPGTVTSVVDAILQNRDRLPPLRFDCGEQDALLSRNEQLHAALVEAGIGHRYEVFHGGHTWDYWSEHLEDSLRFFSTLLKTSGAAVPSGAAVAGLVR